MATGMTTFIACSPRAGSYHVAKSLSTCSTAKVGEPGGTARVCGVKPESREARC
jgi:hypothetical protein